MTSSRQPSRNSTSLALGAALLALAGCGGTSSNAINASGDAGSLTDGGSLPDGGVGMNDGGAGTDGGPGATSLVSHPQNPAGGLFLSSWYPPNGTDADEYAYDDFTLPATHAITQVAWRGGYLRGGSQVTGFTITIFPSLADGTQPQTGNPQLAESPLAAYKVTGSAGQTPAGTIAGIAFYDYSFTLPTPFQATGGTKYWIRIEGEQPSQPDWGMASATGGDGMYFRFQTGAARFSTIKSGDLAFTLR